MPFRITRVEHASFPDASTVARAAANLRISVEQLLGFVTSFTSQTDRRDGIGHQQVLASELERHLERSLQNAGLASVPKTVSPTLGERVDFAVGPTRDPPFLLGEIEFRPNFEKDIVKFAIAARHGRLGLGVLLVSLRRSEINVRYTSMPEYGKVIRTVGEFQPTFPLLVIGLSGEIM